MKTKKAKTKKRTHREAGMEVSSDRLPGTANAQPAHVQQAFRRMDSSLESLALGCSSTQVLLFETPCLL